MSSSSNLIDALFIFVLAGFIGFEVIRRVSPLLHTPLMLLTILGTLLRGGMQYQWIATALVLGTIIGVPLGRVAMTAVPQRTALSHAFGALCVTLVGSAEFYLRTPNISHFMMSVLSIEVI